MAAAHCSPQCSTASAFSSSSHRVSSSSFVFATCKENDRHQSRRVDEHSPAATHPGAS